MAKKIVRPFCLTLLSLSLIVGIERATHAATDGFTLLRIQSDLLPDTKYSPPSLTAEERDHLAEILGQKFHYLASGSQSFVFESADGNYILKFFKHHRFKTPYLVRTFPLPKSLELKRSARIEKKLATLQETLSSCYFSYMALKDDTGIIYPHLTKTATLNLKVTLVDRLKIEHRVDLDHLEFIVQKKAESTPHYFLKLREAKNHEMAKAAFDQLLELSEKRFLMGYVDKDPHLIRNFGFIEGRAVEFDVGGFVPSPHADPRRFYIRDIRKIRTKALSWFQKNYPEIADYVTDQIDSLTEESH